MKTFIVRTSYELEIEAKDEEEARDKFAEQLNDVDASWVEDQIEVKELKGNHE